MNTYAIQSKTMRLRRLSNGETFQLTAGFIYGEGGEEKFIIVVNGSAVVILDSYDEFYRGTTENFGPEFWDKQFWKSNHKEFSIAECGELNEVVDELIVETNTGVNQYYINKEEELCFFDIVFE